MIDKLYPLIRRKTMPEGLMRNPYPPPCNAFSVFMFGNATKKH